MIFGRQDIITTFISRPNARDKGTRAAPGDTGTPDFLFEDGVGFLFEDAVQYEFEN